MEIMRFEAIFDLFGSAPFSSFKFELQLLYEKNVYEIYESDFQGGMGELSEIAMDESEIGIAGDATEEIVLNHLLLNGLGGFVQLDAEHGSQEVRPEPFPETDAARNSGLSSQTGHYSRLV